MSENVYDLEKTSEELVDEIDLDWKTFRSVIKENFKVFFNYSKLFALRLYVLSVITDIKPVINYLIFAQVINLALHLAQNKVLDLKDLVPVMVTYGVYHIGSALLELADYGNKQKINQELSAVIKRAFYDSIDRQPAEFPLNDNKKYEISSALEYLPKTVFGYTQVIKVFSSATTAVIIGMILLSYVPLVVPPLLLLVIPQVVLDRHYRLILAKKSLETRKAFKTENMLAGYLLPNDKLTELRSNGLTDAIKERYFTKLNETDTVYRAISAKWQSGKKALQAINNIVILGGFMMVISRFIKSNGNVGNVYLQLQIVNLFQAKVNETLILFNVLYENAVPIKKVQDCMLIAEGSEPETNDGMSDINLSEGPEIVFDNVTYPSNKADGTSCAPINFKIPAGAKVAVVGGITLPQSIVGSLVNLRNYTGNIYINGTDLKTISRRSLIKSVTTMLGRFHYFYMLSIKDNILFGDKEKPADEFYKALSSSGVLDAIKDCPFGTGQIFDERVSGGMKPSLNTVTRVNLAKIFYKSSPLILISGAFDALDINTHYDILNKLFEHSGKSTVVVSSRYKMAVKKADLIIVCDDNGVLEMGSHTELLNSNGSYAEMYRKVQEDKDKKALEAAQQDKPDVQSTTTIVPDSGKDNVA